MPGPASIERDTGRMRIATACARRVGAVRLSIARAPRAPGAGRTRGARCEARRELICEERLMSQEHEVAQIEKQWQDNARWAGVRRGYTAEDVYRLRGSVHIEHTLARRGAEKLWSLLSEESFVHALGAMTGNQAMQQVKAGLRAIYLSGWQVAADANDAFQMYPDQSLYPVSSVPSVVRKINNAFIRADQIEHAEGKSGRDWFAPIVADAE